MVKGVRTIPPDYTSMSPRVPSVWDEATVPEREGCGKGRRARVRLFNA
jgi:hypothetical protein